MSEKKLSKASEAPVQQGFHLVSFGQDENLVISSSCSSFVGHNPSSRSESHCLYFSL